MSDRIVQHVKRGESEARSNRAVSLPQLTALTHSNFLYSYIRSTACARAISRFDQGRPRIPRENSPLGDAAPNFQWSSENRIPTIDNQFSYPL